MECPVCGYKAESEEEMKEHMKEMVDVEHRELMEEEAGDKMNNIGDQIERAKEETKKKSEDIIGDIKKKL